jgi:hypothetical protein
MRVESRARRQARPRGNAALGCGTLTAGGGGAAYAATGLHRALAYDPAVPMQLLRKWLISSQLGSKLQPLLVGVVEASDSGYWYQIARFDPDRKKQNRNDKRAGSADL